MNTLIAPSCAAISAMIYMNYINEIKYEDLVGCILGGAVSITAGCYTMDWWAACIIGFTSSLIYFSSIWFVRKKLIIDDPLCVTSIHLFCGYYGGFVQGIFANGTVSEKGLLYGWFGGNVFVSNCWISIVIFVYLKCYGI